jgi:hypothetical protein
MHVRTSQMLDYFPLDIMTLSSGGGGLDAMVLPLRWCEESGRGEMGGDRTLGHHWPSLHWHSWVPRWWVTIWFCLGWFQCTRHPELQSTTTWFKSKNFTTKSIIIYLVEIHLKYFRSSKLQSTFWLSHVVWEAHSMVSRAGTCSRVRVTVWGYRPSVISTTIICWKIVVLNLKQPVKHSVFTQ